MIKVENVEVWGFEHAIRGMRNPLNSWDKSDSEFIPWDETAFELGKNDLELMRKLYRAGIEHRKYLRQIFVSMDITAPLYWWKEFDTYKIGTVANSCSTMHTIHKKEFELDDFSHEHLFGDFKSFEHKAYEPIFFRSDTVLMVVIEALNFYRQRYLETNDKKYWWQIIQLLPSSYNQKRTITMNYENVVNILHQRSGHKLDEWIRFCDTISELPYIEKIMIGGRDDGI